MGGSAIETADLTVFLAVARTGSFGRAAVELQLAQPSVSARMAALEHKLGTRLFDRRPRGTSLTPAGERFGDYARRCVALLAEAEAAVRAEGVDRIVVAAPASLGGAVFPTVLEAMSGQPVDVVCRIAHSDESVAALLDGSAHAAFVLWRVLPPGLDSIPVATSPVVAMTTPGHPAAAIEHPHPGDLVNTPVAVHNWSDQAREVSAVFADPRRTPDHPVRLVGTPDIAVDLALRAGYVAVVPRYAAARALRAGHLRLIPLPDMRSELQIRLAYRAEAARRPGVRLLLSAVPRLAEQVGHAPTAGTGTPP